MKNVTKLIMMALALTAATQLVGCGKDDGSAPTVGQATITVKGKAQ